MTQRRYALWDIECGNLVRSYETEAEALAGVREAARRNGPEDVELLGLTYTDDAGQLQRLGAGRELLDRACAAASRSAASA